MRQQNCEKRLLASSCLSVRPRETTPLPLNGFSSNLTIFFENLYKKSISLNSDNNNGTSQEELCTFMVTSRPVLLIIRNVSDKIVEKILTYILCSVTFFPKNRAVYEIMSKNTAETERPQVTIWCVRIACWIPKAKQCNIYWFSIATMVVRTRLTITLYAHCLSCQPWCAYSRRYYWLVYVLGGEYGKRKVATATSWHHRFQYWYVYDVTCNMMLGQ